MTPSNIPKESGEKAAGTTPSQIVIEVEGLGDPGTMLCLRVDTHLVAKNLTTAQMKFLVGEILDRIEAGKEKRQLH